MSESRNRRTRYIAMVAAFLAVMVTPLASVWAQDSSSTDDDAVQVIDIELGTFYFQVSGQDQNAPINLQTGVSYALKLHNVDSMLHEALIGKDPGSKDGHPHDYQTSLFDGVETKVETSDAKIEGSSLSEVEVQAGATVTVFFTLPDSVAGTWEIGCFQPGHYEGGMHAPVIVK